MVMRLVISRAERTAECLGILDAAEGFWECRLIVSVSKWLSENGLSCRACGRLCDLVTHKRHRYPLCLRRRSTKGTLVALKFR